MGVPVSPAHPSGWGGGGGAEGEGPTYIRDWVGRCLGLSPHSANPGAQVMTLALHMGRQAWGGGDTSWVPHTSRGPPSLVGVSEARDGHPHRNLQGGSSRCEAGLGALGSTSSFRPRTPPQVGLGASGSTGCHGLPGQPQGGPSVGTCSGFLSALFPLPRPQPSVGHVPK